MAALPSLQSANLTWDIASADGATITAGSGTWDTNITTAWNNGTGSVKWTSAADNAIFAGADAPTDTFYDVSVVGSVSSSNLTFNNSGYRLTAASPVTIAGANASTITLATGKTATIGQNVTLARSTGGATNFNITGAGTLNVEGTLDQTFNTNAQDIKGGPTVNIKPTGQFNARTSMVVGSSGNITLNTTTTLNVEGAVNFNTQNSSSNTTAGNFVINNGTTGAATVNVKSGGTITSVGSNVAVGLRFSASTGGGSATLNLEAGGTVSVQKVFQTNNGTSTFNFDGGTLKATNDNASFMTGLTNTFVKSGGAKIDSNGKAITIGQALLTDAVSTGGGFEKLGAGNLTLSGANTYTGGTKVSAGTLAITGSITNSSGIDVATGATFTKGDAVASYSKAFTLAENATVNGGTLGISATSLAVSGDLADGFTAATINNFTKGGGLTLNLTNTTAGTYSLFTGSSLAGSFGSVSIGMAALNSQGSGVFSGTVGSFAYTFTDASNSLEVQAIPEPASLGALAGFGALGLVATRRRRRAV